MLNKQQLPTPQGNKTPVVKSSSTKASEADKVCLLSPTGEKAVAHMCCFGSAQRSGLSHSDIADTVVASKGCFLAKALSLRTDVEPHNTQQAL